jgi:hypothetical protein
MAFSLRWQGGSAESHAPFTGGAPQVRMVAIRSRAPIVVLLAGAATVACREATPPSGEAPARLAFTVQPQNATAGGGIALAVAIQDASGNIVTSATSAVTLALGANPGGGRSPALRQ